MRLVLIAGLLLSTVAQSKTEQLSLELKRMPFQRSYFFPDNTEWGHEATLLYKVSVFNGRVWMDSDITGQTINGRFRRTYWDYTLGVKLLPEIDLVWDHRSDHRIDWDADKFQVSDSYGIRINFKE